MTLTDFLRTAATVAPPIAYYVFRNMMQRPPPPPERKWLLRFWKLSEMMMILPWNVVGGTPSLSLSIRPPPPPPPGDAP